jgi:glyoxylase-like metal-dependent hydrolase (beta-lactamase superfamily II)
MAMGGSTVTVTEVGHGLFRFGDGHVNWYVVEEGGVLMLVDGGMPAHWSALTRWLAGTGRSLDALRAVVLTHGHADHLGIVRRAAAVIGEPVRVHAEDLDHARGRGLRTPPRRLRRSLWQPHVLSLTLRWARAGLFTVPPIVAASTYVDGDVLDVPGRLRVIHTPGHSPGSSCLVLDRRDTVLTGDALVTLDVVTGRRGVGIMPGTLNDDPEQAFSSLSALTGVRAGVVLPGHGEPFRDGVPAALALARGAGIDWRAAPADAHGHRH